MFIIRQKIHVNHQLNRTFKVNSQTNTKPQSMLEDIRNKIYLTQEETRANLT